MIIVSWGIRYIESSDVLESASTGLLFTAKFAEILKVWCRTQYFNHYQILYNITIKWFIVVANVINNQNPIISHSLSYYILSMLLRLFLLYIYDRNTTRWCINAHVSTCI